MELEAGGNPARSRHCNRSLPSRPAILEVRPGHDDGNNLTGREIPRRGEHVRYRIGARRAARHTDSACANCWPWLVFGGLLALLALYFVGAEEGATSLISGMYVHEWVHDGRHLLGFPCH